MIRFLLVLLAFVSALLAFIFQETMLFVAAGGLLLVSVVILLLQVRDQSKRKNRLKLPNDLTPEDELRARGVIEIRPKVKPLRSSVGYAPPELRPAIASNDELQLRGILEVREKSVESEDVPSIGEEERAFDDVFEEPAAIEADEETPPEISWSALTDDEAQALPDLFSFTPESFESTEPVVSELDSFSHTDGAIEPELEVESTMSAEVEVVDAATEDVTLPWVEEALIGEPVALEEETAEESLVLASTDDPTRSQTESEFVDDDNTVATAVDSELTSRRRASRRRVEVDAHLPALQISLGAHTICLIDVDTDTSVYRLRSIVSSGLVDHAGTEYPFAGFFLSDLFAETTVLDIGPSGLALPDLRYHRDLVQLIQVVAAPVMKNGLPAAFLVAGFEHVVDENCTAAVTRAAAFFSSLYELLGDHPTQGDSPLVRAKRKPPSLRLVKSNPKSSQSKIIAEEMTRARGQSFPLAFALVCLDKGDEISRFDKVTVFEVEEWMRRCLEQITPDGRIEYLGELGYGIVQLRDVSDVEGWVKRAQHIFRSQHGPVDAQPIVGVAMLSEGHRDPEDLQADAVRALRAAYETGDSTILVG